MYKETVFKETFLISIVNITATESGQLVCKASNEFGDAEDSSLFLATGEIVIDFFYV